MTPCGTKCRIFIEFFGYWESFLVASNHGWAWSPERAKPVAPKLSKFYTADTAYYSTAVHDQLFALPPTLMQRVAA